jgi:hypothetical protein
LVLDDLPADLDEDCFLQQLVLVEIKCTDGLDDEKSVMENLLLIVFLGCIELLDYLYKKVQSTKLPQNHRG